MKLLESDFPAMIPQKLRDCRLGDVLSRGISQKSRNKCEIEGTASGGTLRRSERFLFTAYALHRPAKRTPAGGFGQLWPFIPTKTVFKENGFGLFNRKPP
jgi:hypothetical protein